MERLPYRLSVILPTYNEAERLPQTLGEIVPYLQSRFEDYEVIVVDDNSPDKSYRHVEEMSKVNPKVRLLLQPSRIGKGAAVKRGCLDAKLDYVLFMDADHATPIQEVEHMLSKMKTEHVDSVAGVRIYQENESRWRRIIGFAQLIFAHLIVFQRSVIDTQCGFKLFTRHAVQKIFPPCQIDGGMLDVELFFLMHKFGLRCYYQPVAWDNKPGSRIRIIHCMIFDPIDLIKIRLRDIMGVYRGV